MSLFDSLNGWLAPVGGLVTAAVLFANAWHNKEIRKYESRKAVALEKIAGIPAPERSHHKLVSFVWPKPIRRRE